MTLDEAIKHAEEVADLYEYEANKYAIMSGSYESHMAYHKCGEKHRQFAEWLEELKQLREQRNEDIAKAFQFGLAFGFAKKI